MSVKKKFKIILFVLAFMVMAFSLFRMITKPGLDVEEVTTEAKISWSELVSTFETNEIRASELYTDKVIEVSGTVIDLSESDKSQVIVLGDGNSGAAVICQIQEDDMKHSSKVKVGDKVVIKGLCTGFLMDVMLIRCKVVEF